MYLQYGKVFYKHIEWRNEFWNVDKISIVKWSLLSPDSLKSMMQVWKIYEKILVILSVTITLIFLLFPFFPLFILHIIYLKEIICWKEKCDVLFVIFCLGGVIFWCATVAVSSLASISPWRSSSPIQIPSMWQGWKFSTPL